MNRRDFFKTALALLGAPYLPRLQAAEPAGDWFTIDAVRRSAEATGSIGQYAAVMHSRAVDDLMRELTPKERWKIAYRQARMEIKNMAKKVLYEGQIGSYESFRFVESRA